MSIVLVLEQHAAHNIDENRAVAYRGFLAPGPKMGIGAPPFGVSDWQAQRRSSSLMGDGSEVEP